MDQGAREQRTEGGAPFAYTIRERRLLPDEARMLSSAIRETPNILGYLPRELLAFSSCLVAESTGDGVFAGACLTKHLGRNWCEISLVLVLAGHRRKGVGSALFRAAFEGLREQNRQILCVSREASILRLMEAGGMRFLPEWQLPLPVRIAQARHYSSLYRFREGLRKIPMYRDQPPFRYAVYRSSQ
ncbi:MAG: GNAT family N-acetyltransferase [Cytophagales bacterium]|nr:GNAT family N-acetyltransferase [Armatimonadota bacterium]